MSNHNPDEDTDDDADEDERVMDKILADRQKAKEQSSALNQQNLEISTLQKKIEELKTGKEQAERAREQAEKNYASAQEEADNFVIEARDNKEEALETLQKRLTAENNKALDTLKKEHAAALATLIKEREQAEEIIADTQEKLDELTVSLKRLEETTEQEKDELRLGAADAATACTNRIDQEVNKCKQTVSNLRERLQKFRVMVLGEDAAVASVEPSSTDMIPKKIAREEYVYKPSTLMF